MAAISQQCPHCHQTVPTDVHTCPHCSVYLHMPDYPGFATQAQTDQVATQPPPPARPPAATGTLPDTIKQCDAAATTSMIVAGVLIALYAGAIVAGKVRAGLFFNAFVYALPMLLLLCTIVLSARVFDPAGYFSDDYPTLFKRKEKRLRQSLLSLELAVALLAVSVFFYLLRPASIP